jgi:hypothetical protein
MKRIVILIDGTWNKEGITGNTNVAALGSQGAETEGPCSQGAETDGPCGANVVCRCALQCWRRLSRLCMSPRRHSPEPKAATLAERGHKPLH